MASSHITSWQIEGSSDRSFLWLPNHSRRWVQPWNYKTLLLLERKAITNLVQFSSVAQSCPTLCDPMNCSMPGLPVHHQLLEFTQTHIHRVSDAIQPSHPLSSPSPPAPNPSQHQSLFQWVNSSHEVAKVLQFPRQHIKKQRHHFANKGPYSQSSGFSGLHVQMWKLVHKEDWAPKNWCFRILVLEKTLERPLDCKEIKRVNSKGNQLLIFTGRTLGENEAPVVLPPDVKSGLIGKHPAGKDWRQKEKGVEEDEMVR